MTNSHLTTLPHLADVSARHMGGKAQGSQGRHGEAKGDICGHVPWELYTTKPGTLPFSTFCSLCFLLVLFMAYFSGVRPQDLHNCVSYFPHYHLGSAQGPHNVFSIFAIA